MTLAEVIRRIEVIASRQPSINMIVRNDIFRLNEKADARYGVFGWTQNQHSSSLSSGEMRYSFTFFYVDRLTHDRGNEVEVQSVGISTLDNIVKMLDEFEVYSNNDYTFTTFNQRFTDECAGVFCNIAFTVDAGSVCADNPGGDFNLDFNDDFLIY